MNDDVVVRQSRWIKRSAVPRYTKEQRKALDKFVECFGWHRGARVRKA